MALRISILPQEVALAPQTGPQVAYALLTIAADAGGPRPIHWAFIADASPSMRIPMLRDDDFRSLVRQKAAREVLVDGLPVWQIEGEVPPEIKANALSALDYTARALHMALEQLTPTDRFALIGCADQARILVGGEQGHDRHALALGIGQLKTLDLGDETDLSRGMRSALIALERMRRISGETGAVERILLLTDGFTRYPEACERLAREAAAAGITVSTFGLGGEFAEGLLLQLADLSGGRASLLATPDEIPAAISAELAAARRVAARALELRLHLPQGVQLRRATRLAPSLALLEQSNHGPQQIALRLGDLLADRPVRVLLELLVPPMPTRASRRRLAALEALSGEGNAQSELIGNYFSVAPAMAQPLVAGIARASALHQHERARQALAAGNRAQAQQALLAAAAQFERLGEANLAAAARHEAATLAAGTLAPAAVTKALTYATRRLGEDELNGV